MSGPPDWALAPFVSPQISTLHLQHTSDDVSSHSKSSKGFSSQNKLPVLQPHTLPPCSHINFLVTPQCTRHSLSSGPLNLCGIFFSPQITIRGNKMRAKACGYLNSTPFTLALSISKFLSLCDIILYTYLYVYYESSPTRMLDCCLVQYCASRAWNSAWHITGI